MGLFLVHFLGYSLGGFIRAGKDTAVRFSERKGAEMARNVREKYPTNLRDQEASGSNPDTPTIEKS